MGKDAFYELKQWKQRPQEACRPLLKGLPFRPLPSVPHPPPEARGPRAPILHTHGGRRGHAAPSDRIGLALSCTCNVYVSNDMTPKSTNAAFGDGHCGAESSKQSPRSLSFATGFGGSRSLHNTRPNLSPRLAASRLSWVIERRSKWTAAFSRLSHREAPNPTKWSWIRHRTARRIVQLFWRGGFRPTPTKKSWRSPLKMSRTPKKKGSTDENAAPNHTTATAQQTAEAKAKYLSTSCGCSCGRGHSCGQGQGGRGSDGGRCCCSQSRPPSSPPSAVSGPPACFRARRAPSSSTATAPNQCATQHAAVRFPAAAHAGTRMAEPQDAIEVARSCRRSCPRSRWPWETPETGLPKAINCSRRSDASCSLLRLQPHAASCSLLRLGGRRRSKPSTTRWRWVHGPF